MNEYTYELKIPKERIAVLIGKDGEIKKELEEITKTTINVDSKEGDVQLVSKDSVQLYLLKDLVRAIARGFNPEIAKRLLKQDYVLDVLNLSDYVKSKDQMLRLKGRVIGKNGKARTIIEELTDTSISVYGKTIAVIGFCDNAAVAKKALESLLTGSPHSSVFKWLEQHRKQQKFAELANF
ncbi:KH domain-containing protein [Candidatus Woesearchaeota archaeon]|nr:KH domain-containing protein [Candidatus Woesearchaeota archaeon]